MNSKVFFNYSVLLCLKLKQIYFISETEESNILHSWGEVYHVHAIKHSVIWKLAFRSQF